jgi:hypothetical protein
MGYLRMVHMSFGARMILVGRDTSNLYMTHRTWQNRFRIASREFVWAVRSLGNNNSLAVDCVGCFAFARFGNCKKVTLLQKNDWNSANKQYDQPCDMATS